MSVPIPVVVFLCCAGFIAGTLHLMGRPGRGRRPGAPQPPSLWTLTLRTPALLVPTLLAAITAWIALECDFGYLRVSENPFGAGGHYNRVSGFAQNAWVLVVMSMLVAGYVGLLWARHRGIKPDGLHFWQGIKDHTLTFLLAKLAACGWISLSSEFLSARDGVTTIVYLAPSLLFAPLLGVAALHPRRPLRALGAVFERTWDMHSSGKLLLGQILALMLLWVFMNGFGQGSLRNIDAAGALREIYLLAQDASTLSFNAFPFLSIVQCGGADEVVGIGSTIAAMVISTVFMHMHFRRVMQQPQKPR